MDVKQLIKQPETQLQALGIEPGSARGGQLLERAQEAQTLKKALKQAKNDKAAVARGFRELDKDSEAYRAQVERMQAASASVKEAEARLKQLEKSLRAELSSVGTEESDRSDELPLFHIDFDRDHGGPLEVAELPVERWAEWDRFLDRLARPAPQYVRSAWLSVMQRAFGRPTRLWVVFDGQGELIGGVPVSVFDSRLFGRFGVAVPYVNYGGVITEYGDVAHTLLDEMARVRERERLEHIEIRTVQKGMKAPAVGRKVSMILPLPESPEALETSLSSKVRAQCRKAEAWGPEFVVGGQELLPEFYRVFACNMRDLGTPVYSKKLFSEILAHKELDARIALVRVEGKAVSGGFLMGANGMLEIPWASTLKSANSMDANMWMYRQILDYAVQRGYRFFDFGRSTRDSGTYRFKKQWGARPHDHHWYYLLPEGGELPSLNPDNPKYRLVIAVWKCLPVWLTRWLGPPIVARIP